MQKWSSHLFLFYIFTEVGSKRIFIYIVLLSMLSFQSFMGISQFVGGISNYGMTEKLVTSDIEQNTTFSRIVGIYGSPNSHGFSVAILLLLSLPFIIKRNKWFLSAVGGLGILNIIISQSRSVWLGFLVLLMLYIKQAYNYIRRVLPYIFRKKNLLCSLGIDNIHINSLSENRGKRGFFYRRGRGHLREEMFTEGLQLIKESPWVGYGVGTEIRVLLNRFPNGYIHTFPFEIHNMFFVIATESGLPATIAFFLPFFLLLGIWIIKIRKKIPVRYSFICAVSGVIMMLTYYSLQPVYGRRDFVTLGIILGMGIGTTMKKATKNHEHSKEFSFSLEKYFYL